MLFKTKLELNLENERKRIAIHSDLFVLFQNQIQRSKEGGSLEGDLGRMIDNTIRSVRAGGRRGKGGKGERHMLLANMWDASVHIQREVVRQLAVVRRAPLEVLGPLPQNPEWTRARDLSGFDLAGMQTMEWACACGASALRPMLEPGFPPGLTAVPAHRYIGIASPTNPLSPLGYIEFMPDTRGSLTNCPIMVMLISDPLNPRYEYWDSITSLLEYERTNGQRTRGMQFRQSGINYPWWYQGRPLLPVVFYQGDNVPMELTPAFPVYLLGTIDIMLENTENKAHSYVSAPNRLIVSSEQGVQGLDRASLDYASALDLKGKNISTSIQPSGTDASKGLMEITKGRIDQWLSQVNRGLRLREKGPQSGYAISLEMSDLWNWWRQQSTANAPKDAQAVRVLVSTWNYAIKAGYWQGALLPEIDEIGIEYKPTWTHEQQQQILDSIFSAIEIGAATEVDYYLALHGQSNAHRAEAERAIIELKKEKGRIQRSSEIYDVRLTRQELDLAGRQGVSSAIQFIELERDKAVGIAAKALVDGKIPLDTAAYAALRAPDVPLVQVATTEDASATWVAPRNVASEASAGSALYSRFNKPGTPAAERRGSPAAYRMAGKLKRGDQLNRGDLVDIVTFTDEAEQAGGGQAGWGDDQDPSTQWIDFRCYGGEPGRTWANGELDKLDGVPGGNEEKLVPDDGGGDAPVTP